MGEYLGNMTLQEVSTLINKNRMLSMNLKLVIRWAFEGDKMRARITNGDVIVYQKYYSGDYAHILMARMHKDWCAWLEDEDRKRKVIERKAKEAAERDAKDQSKMTAAERVAYLKKMRGEDETSQVPMED